MLTTLSSIAVGSLLFPVAFSWHTNRVHYLDHDATSGNFLFRGAFPGDKHAFDYDGLVATLRNVSMVVGAIPLEIVEAKLALPANFQLLDLSFVSPIDPKETPDFFAEKKYFQEHKDQGQFLSWPIVGSLTPPSLVPPASRKQKAETLGTWDVDHITYKMSNLTSFLRTKSATPVVIYMHCEAGVDRTGEMSGNYMMAHYPNMTWAKALQIDDNVEPRAIASASQNGMNWFCLFLYYSNPDFQGLGCPGEK